MNKYFLLLIIAAVSFAQEKSVIAVADVSAEGLSKIQIKQFRKRLESDLVNLGQYSVTSRQEMDKILREQKFQQSGCTDQECAAEIGRMLNADYMLLSDVLYDHESGDISVTLQLVSVETAEITTSISEDETVSKPRDINKKLHGYLVGLYRRGSEKKNIIAAPTLEEKALGKGKLIIKSTPVGANIILDNEDRGLTPLELDGIDEGEHRLILTYDGYERYPRYVTVISDSTLIVEGGPIPMMGNLDIKSTPSECNIFLNDEYKGKTPMTLQYLEIGEYSVKLTKEKYEDKFTTVTVEWNKTAKLREELSPKPASVAFYSVPDGAKVFIDNKLRGKTTNKGLKLTLTTGRHTVKMQLKGYSDVTDNLELAPAEITDLQLQLLKLPEPSIIVKRPNGGEAWELSSTQTVKWASENLSKSSYISIKLYKNGRFSQTIAKREYNDGSYNWTIPSYLSASGKYKIRIEDNTKSSVYDESDVYFTLSVLQSRVNSLDIRKRAGTAKSTGKDFDPTGNSGAKSKSHREDRPYFYFNYPSIYFNNSTFSENLEEGVIEPVDFAWGLGFEYGGDPHLIGFDYSMNSFDVINGIDTTNIIFEAADVYYTYSLLNNAIIKPSIGLGYQASGLRGIIDEEHYGSESNKANTSDFYFLGDIKIGFERIDLDGKGKFGGVGIGATYKKSITLEERKWDQLNIYLYLSYGV